MFVPLPNAHDPADVHAYYTLPEVFTHLQWTLWQVSMVAAIASCLSTPGKSSWPGTGCSPDHYLHVAYPCYHSLLEFI